MARTRNLEVVISGDAKDLERAFKRVDQAADKSSKGIRGFASITTSGFSRIGVAASSMGAIAGGAVVLMGKQMVDTASDINESLTKNQVLFGRYARDVERFSRTSAAAFGISRKAALEYTGTFGNLFNALGISNRESAKFSVNLVKLAADMASFNNSTPEEALEAIRSGLVGETEPLRRFGVNMQDATLRQEALRQGLIKTTKEALTPQQKALAAQALIVRQTSAAHGDFARTSGGLANQQRILKARLSDLQGEIGAKLLPATVKVTSALNDFIDGMRRGKGAGGDFARELRKFGNDVHNVERFIRGAVEVGQTFNSWLQRADRAVGRVDASINRGLVSGFNRIVSAGQKVIGVVRSIVGWLGKIKVPDINLPFGLGGSGDGPGLPAIPNLTGVGAGNLMGAQPALTPFAAVGSRFGLHVSSGRRPGSITSSGNVSYHSTGEAVDLAGPPGGMLSTFRYLKSRFGPRLAELIHTPGGAGIKDGRPYTYGGQVAADHYDHVHVAFDTGKPGVGDGLGANGTTIARFLLGRGFSTPQVAGIMGNLRQESGFDPGAVENNGRGPGIGIAQWSFGRADALRAFAQKRGGSWKSLSTQLAFMMSEFQGSESRAYRGIRSAKTVEEAETAFGRLYERYGVMGNRSGRQYLAAVQALAGKGGGTTAARSGGGGGGGGGAADTTNPYELAIAGSDVEIAQAQEGGVRRGAGGRVVSSPALRETSAQRNRLSIVNRRIAKVQKALKRKLTPATRLRLRQELAGLMGERATIRGRLDELAQLPESTDSGAGTTVDGSAEADGGGQENQALVDAINANTAAQQEAAAAAREHASQLEGVKTELKRQTDFATSVQSTESFQLKKYLADLISGQVGGYGVAPRSYTPGTGVAHAY